MKILVADDDPQIIRALTVTLRARGYDIVTAEDGAGALNQAIEHHPDLIMLDLGMPNLDGIDVIHGIRGWSTVPILVVSGRTGEADKVEALDAGADDYVTKPFSIDELLARIRALTRRVLTVEDAPLITFGTVTVDLVGKHIYHGSIDEPDTIRLTPTEWAILEVLLRSPGKLITRDALLTEVWGVHHTNDSGYLRVYIAQLRKKLEPVPAQPRYLITESGMGYRFNPDRIASERPAESQRPAQSGER
ncbi:response regulator [Subtercola boreus]|uniref:DNA-binding response regulator n=1 Tax=Subtercola boreus TaxID=120213 RepID=A0A3E0WC33_9MICO|nr:response regulator transcription factor [Subtercola boreus]RFA21143.1 DNA-binding response regulator [Subtercola boreus]RFA21526.1 DNA-binding response regulator [Subtercola boreus]RFA27496.1 DNA-binding response regulator [Subtercola boreus]